MNITAVEYFILISFFPATAGSPSGTHVANNIHDGRLCASEDGSFFSSQTTLESARNISVTVQKGAYLDSTLLQKTSEGKLFF